MYGIYKYNTYVVLFDTPILSSVSGTAQKTPRNTEVARC